MDIHVIQQVTVNSKSFRTKKAWKWECVNSCPFIGVHCSLMQLQTAFQIETLETLMTLEFLISFHMSIDDVFLNILLLGKALNAMFAFKRLQSSVRFHVPPNISRICKFLETYWTGVVAEMFGIKRKEFVENNFHFKAMVFFVNHLQTLTYLIGSVFAVSKLTVDGPFP